MKISSIKKVKETLKVYDFTVDDVHHYVLDNGVISHNSYIPMKEMSGGCLVSGTEILAEYGSVNIEKVSVGDNVWTKEGVLRPVTRTFHYRDKPTVTIEFEDGYKVACTPEHKFLIDGKWVEARELVAGLEVDMV